MNSLLIAAAQTNHIKAKIDKTPKIANIGLCVDRDETINHIISECSKLAQNEYKTRHNWVGKVIHWELCQEIYPYEQMVHAQPRICPGEWDAQTPMGFWRINGSPNLGQNTRPYNNQQKIRRTYKIVNFAVLDDHRVKSKENEKKISTWML